MFLAFFSLSILLAKPLLSSCHRAPLCFERALIDIACMSHIHYMIRAFVQAESGTTQIPSSKISFGMHHRNKGIPTVRMSSNVRASSMFANAESGKDVGAVAIEG